MRCLPGWIYAVPCHSWRAHMLQMDVACKTGRAASRQRVVKVHLSLPPCCVDSTTTPAWQVAGAFCTSWVMSLREVGHPLCLQRRLLWWPGLGGMLCATLQHAQEQQQRRRPISRARPQVPGYLRCRVQRWKTVAQPDTVWWQVGAPERWLRGPWGRWDLLLALCTDGWHLQHRPPNAACPHDDSRAVWACAAASRRDACR